MPLYEFACDGCGATTGRVQSMRDKVPAVVDCESCGGPARRVWHAPAAIHFHGPGFYATDPKTRMNMRRRANAGDDLPKPFDRDAAALTGTL